MSATTDELTEVSGQQPGAAIPPAPRKTLLQRVTPFALLAPVVIILGLLIGYPLVRLIIVSFQEFGRAQVFGRPPEFVGFDNYRAILTDAQFWRVLVRSVLFCAVNVVLTMGLGIAVAVLLTKLHPAMRWVTSTALLIAWAMPPLTAIIIWGWMFDTQFGVVNYLITTFTPADFTGHSWLIEPWSFFLVATVVIVWQSIPFVAFSVYAGLTQVPEELLEAAQLDGADRWQRARYVVLPFLRSVLIILTVLQIIWDLRVFTQIYALQGIGGIREKTSTLGVYIYQVSVGSGDFGQGGAMAVLLVVLMLGLAVVYVRSTLKEEEA